MWGNVVINFAIFTGIMLKDPVEAIFKGKLYLSGRNLSNAILEWRQRVYGRCSRENATCYWTQSLSGCIVCMKTITHWSQSLRGLSGRNLMERYVRVDVMIVWMPSSRERNANHAIIERTDCGKNGLFETRTGRWHQQLSYEREQKIQCWAKRY